MKTVYETCDQITQVCSTNGGHETLCLTQDGKVLMLSNNWDKDDCQGNLSKGIDIKNRQKIEIWKVAPIFIFVLFL